MAYFRVGRSGFESHPGRRNPGASAGLGRSGGLAETYVRSEIDEWPWTPPTGPSLGEDEPPRGRFRLAPDLRLRQPPVARLDGFPAGEAALVGSHAGVVSRLADLLLRSWETGSPVVAVRLEGHTDPRERTGDHDRVGMERARAVRQALMHALERRQSGLSGGVRLFTESRGARQPLATDNSPQTQSRNRRVEVYFHIGNLPLRLTEPELRVPRAAPPGFQIPPLRPPSPPSPQPRIPTGEELRRFLMRSQLRPETPAQRLERLLTTPPPPGRPRRAFSEMFWRMLNERLDRAMSRLNVPRNVRGPVREAVRGAIERGASALLDRALEQAGLSTEARDAVRSAAAAALETPMW